jgi:hypothetical protein
MSELLLFLATRLIYLLEPGRFRIVDSQLGSSQGGDALLVLESNKLRLRLTRDRDQFLMTFQPLSVEKDWFSPGLMRGLFTGEPPKSEVLDDAWALELDPMLRELERRLSDPTESDATISGLKQQAKLRAKEMFG